MPLYEYECETCGIRFERREHFSDDPTTTCPECGGVVHRLVHPAAIIFKGKGFYVTDNHRSSTLAVPPKTKKESKTPEPEKK